MEQWKASLQDGQAHHAGIEEHLGDVVHLREFGSDLAKYWIMHKNGTLGTLMHTVHCA